uniref:Uncharacterized protein n=1 Tax=Chromera velia CCMP2878 TaxID=1169474 RepID=A0A0G4HAZ5_9ALVE|eukprot:Cvel_25857.t1-p1 / transcript=Cvel_25857.t1 / gene=Cvel_25857 / organism=Chromera_velia_CCMP2878 / gene_product=hypothetical protein / transcript_product=hypothetical protein / location=Cvel_scaffold2981:19164-19893(-) / protein_length=148 / sequence_SO=supercontig / SO=protein_coding / is_pseudo=false
MHTDESIAQYVCPEGASLSGTNYIETRIVSAVETRFPYTVSYPPAAQCEEDWSFHPPAGSCLNTTEEVVSDADLSDFATADPTWTCESAPEVPVKPEETCERTEYNISYSCPPGASIGPDGCYITTFFPATRVEPSTSTTPAPEVPEY